MLLGAPNMNRALPNRVVFPMIRITVAAMMAIILVVLAPFASALEIHHELAAVDHDGHEHSASDLCQWVQHHTGFSILSVVPSFAAFHVFVPLARLVSVSELSVRLILIGPSRAPPSS